MGRRGRDRSERRGRDGSAWVNGMGQGWGVEEGRKKNEREKSTDGLGWRQVEEEVVEAGQSVVGVYKKPTNSPNPTRPEPTRRIGSVFRAWWVGLGYKIFFDRGLGSVWVIKLQTCQTWPDPPIFNIYLKYIIYLIIFKNTSCRAALPWFLLLILI